MIGNCILGFGCDIATDTDRIIREYKNQYLVDDHAHKNELAHAG